MVDGETDPLDQHIAARLRHLRRQRKWSLERTAELIQVSPQQLSRLELGRNRLTAAQLHRLARGFDVTLSWFSEGYTESAEELGRVRNVVQEPRDEWLPGGEEEDAALLVTYWRALPTVEQRRRFLDLLATLTGHA